MLFYAPEDILKWANHRRNAKYLDRLIAALVPDELRQVFLPQSIALPPQPTGTVGPGLLAPHP